MDKRKAGRPIMGYWDLMQSERDKRLFSRAWPGLSWLAKQGIIWTARRYMVMDAIQRAWVQLTTKPAKRVLYMAFPEGEGWYIVRGEQTGRRWGGPVLAQSRLPGLYPCEAAAMVEADRLNTNCQ